MKDKTIAILESRLGEQLAELISRHGGRPFCAPALAELPDLDPQAIAELIPALEADPPRVAIFQTAVGTRALFEATDALRLTDRLLAVLAAATVVARGPKPSGALRSRGVRIDFNARDPFTTRELLEAMQSVPLVGQRVLVQRHGILNVELDQALAAQGARVLEIPIYRWSLPQDVRPLQSLIDALERGEIDAVAFTNAEQVRNLYAVAAADGRKEALDAALAATLIASIGPVCSAALREQGIAVDAEASPPKLGELIAVLNRSLAP